MVRKLKKNRAGRWVYAGGKDKGRFAPKESIEEFRAQQRRNGRKGNVRRTKRLQNSIATTALNLDVSMSEAAGIIATYLNERESAAATGQEAPQWPGSP